VEKLVANIVANPNIRYLVLCWRESKGHLPADALACLVENGVATDRKRTIKGAGAPTPYLPNLSVEAIERFRRQITIVNLISDEDPKVGMEPGLVREAVMACIQEKPTRFLGYSLWDPGAWPEPPICRKVVMKMAEPWKPELSEDEAAAIERIMEAARKRQK
jgi:tetrahydromethanopterin S-methyltransferase subunit A